MSLATLQFLGLVVGYVFGSLKGLSEVQPRRSRGRRISRRGNGFVRQDWGTRMSPTLRDNLADALRTAAAALIVTLVAVGIDRLLF